ncbi:MAG TPA: FtsX-like permease family protein [Candidatus Acidoferrales bacterium]
MKYLHLISANLFRKKLRTTLTVGSFIVALFLFGFLAIIHGAFNGGLDVVGVDRLMVINKVSIIQPLPLSYRDQIQRIPGVKYVTYQSWFGGIYQDPKNFFPSFAVDPDTQRLVFPELAVPDDEWKAFVADREGAIVGKKTADRFHWKIGDRVPLNAPIYGTAAWEFNIRGIYNSPRDGEDLTQFWLQKQYLEERRTFGKGQTGWYTVKLDSPDDSARVIKTIDDMFANSPFETKTETLAEMAASWVKQAGNIEFLILAIGAVVFFTLLLVTGNTMSLAIRERMGELAVMKAVGFSDRFVLFIVLAESILVAVVGGAIGLAFAKLLTILGDPTGGVLQTFFLPSSAILLGIACAIGIGFLAGILPATTAMRLRVVDALRRI